MLVNATELCGNNRQGKLHFLCRIVHMTDVRDTYEKVFNSIDSDTSIVQTLCHDEYWIFVYLLC